MSRSLYFVVTWEVAPASDVSEAAASKLHGPPVLATQSGFEAAMAMLIFR